MNNKIISGIQASGKLHIGNYLGAIKYWKDLQKSHECYFFIADLHAITVKSDPKILKENIYNSVATYLACGIDPNISTLFIQSQIKPHTELAWILQCNTPMGWLKRMTQFKSKAGEKADLSSVALFTYPALMAADILLYDANYVPVGHDQKQHLEFTRDIAELLNRKYNQEIFTLPNPIIPKSGARIMSLTNGANKMSKSDLSDYSRINLTDDKDMINKKIKKAKTDNIAEINYDIENRKEISNLLNIYSSISDIQIEDIVNKYSKSNFVKFKQDLAEKVISVISPIQNKILEYNNNKDYLEKIIKIGAEKANEIAYNKIKIIKEKEGFIT